MNNKAESWLMALLASFLIILDIGYYHDWSLLWRIPIDLYVPFVGMWLARIYQRFL